MPNSIDDAVVELGHGSASIQSPALASSPLLAALRAAGTSHVYADTADVEEVRKLIARDDGSIVKEVDGSTANQPLVRKVVEHYLETMDLAAAA